MISKDYPRSSQHRVSVLFFIFAGFLLCTYSCTPKKKEQKVGNVESTAVVRKPAATYQDTQIISTAAAVFFQMDSLQRARYEATAPGAIFESSTHEYQYLTETTGKILRARWNKLPIFRPAKVRFLCFKKQDQSNFLVDLDKNNEIAGLYVFDGVKDPMIVDMSNADTELERYFAK